MCCLRMTSYSLSVHIYKRSLSTCRSCGPDVYVVCCSHFAVHAAAVRKAACLYIQSNLAICRPTLLPGAKSVCLISNSSLSLCRSTPHACAKSSCLQIRRDVYGVRRLQPLQPAPVHELNRGHAAADLAVPGAAGVDASQPRQLRVVAAAGRHLVQHEIRSDGQTHSRPCAAALCFHAPGAAPARRHLAQRSAVDGPTRMSTGKSSENRGKDRRQAGRQIDRRWLLVAPTSNARRARLRHKINVNQSASPPPQEEGANVLYMPCPPPPLPQGKKTNPESEYLSPKNTTAAHTLS
jgi:hypothetical protein